MRRLGRLFSAKHPIACKKQSHYNQLRAVPEDPNPRRSEGEFKKKSIVNWQAGHIRVQRHFVLFREGTNHDFAI